MNAFADRDHSPGCSGLPAELAFSRTLDLAVHLIDWSAVVVEGGRLQDDTGRAHHHRQRKYPQEEAVQHHGHVLPVFAHLPPGTHGSADAYQSAGIARPIFVSPIPAHRAERERMPWGLWCRKPDADIGFEQTNPPGENKRFAQNAISKLLDWAPRTEIRHRVAFLLSSETLMCND